jgi:hypothetical protein
MNITAFVLSLLVGSQATAFAVAFVKYTRREALGLFGVIALLFQTIPNVFVFFGHSD